MSIQSPSIEQIQPAVLTRLVAHAHSTGKTVNDLLMDMLDERERITQRQEGLKMRASMTSDEWSVMLRAWAASHPMGTAVADDSRESIYEGRGE
ncbi:MAG: hypothetical protein HY267_04520 [Deltaproteobacteria bacterium]|nr:hypothetical protein [Deltaproteobacteria bacterium]